MARHQQLAVLDAIARTGSLTRAAQLLNFAQPTVSHHLTALEAQLGARLVDRAARGAQVNELGHLVLELVRPALAQLDSVELLVRRHVDLETGRLRVGTFPTAGVRLLPPALTAFSSRHPGVELEILEGEPAKLIDAMHQGRLDLSLIFAQPGDASRAHSDVHVEHLFDDPMRLVVPPRMRFSRERPPRLESFQDARWITGTGPHDPCTRLLERACAEAGFEPNIVARSDDYAVIHALVEADLGVALVPELALAAPWPRTVRLESRLLRREVLIAATRTGSSAAARALTADLRVVARSHTAGQKFAEPQRSDRVRQA